MKSKNFTKKNILNSTLALSLALSLTGCLFETPQQPTPTPTPKPKLISPSPKVYKNADDTDSIKTILNTEGKNTLMGNGFMRQKGGGIVTCAGNKVALFPKTNYSTEFAENLYFKDAEFPSYFRNGNGYKNSFTYTINPYGNDSRITLCDSAGNFEFQKLPDGTYYVITYVSWSAPGRKSYDTQGGSMIREVELKNNVTTKIIISE